MERDKITDGETHTFIVRIWNEPRELSKARTRWRGKIEYLPGRRARYFEDLATLMDFISLHAGIKSDPMSDRERDQAS